MIAGTEKDFGVLSDCCGGFGAIEGMHPAITCSMLPHSFEPSFKTRLKLLSSGSYYIGCLAETARTLHCYAAISKSEHAKPSKGCKALLSANLARCHLHFEHAVMFSAEQCAVWLSSTNKKAYVAIASLMTIRILAWCHVYCCLQSFLFQKKAPTMAAEPSSEHPPSLPAQPPQQLSRAYMKSSAVEGMEKMPWSSTVLLGMTGAVAGVASGLLGIGGGTVVTPLLAILTPLSQVNAQFLLAVESSPGKCVKLSSHLQCLPVVGH